VQLETSSSNQRIRNNSWWVYRFAITIAAVAYLFQAVTAGQYLSGNVVFLRMHQQTPIAADAALVAGIVAAILLRWPGRATVRPLVLIIATFLLAQAQAFAGSLRLMSWHVPLGVGVAVFAVVIALHACRQAAPENLTRPRAGNTKRE